MATLPAEFELWAAKTALAPYIKLAKSELKKTLKMVGIDVKSLKNNFHTLMEGKDLIVQMIQNASEYGFDQTFGPYLQLTGNIFKKVREYFNPKTVIKGDNPVMQQIAELTKADIPVIVTIEDIIKNKKDTKDTISAAGENPALKDPHTKMMAQKLSTYPMGQQFINNPMAQQFINNPMAQQFMRHSGAVAAAAGGGKREKEPAEEIEETLNMLINHRLWVLNEAKKKGNKSKAKSKKHTIKKKKMIKNPKKKGTKRRKGSKRR